MIIESCLGSARWAPTSHKWSHKPYKWPCEWVTGVITPINGVINLLLTGRGPPCWEVVIVVASSVALIKFHVILVVTMCVFAIPIYTEFTGWLRNSGQFGLIQIDKKFTPFV